MTLLSHIDARLHDIAQRSLTRQRRVTDSACAPHQVVDGQRLLGFCSNDYLGLASHPQVVEALRDGARRYGAGSGASHLISGHSQAHAQLEQRLGQWMTPWIDEARAITLCTGYMANLAMLTTLGASDEAEIFSEALNHASLIDGARLARANVTVYPHADLNALELLLQASTAPTRIVVTDSVFSMDGVLASLPQLAALCERYNAWLIVDDAHGFGVLGDTGRGALEHFDLHCPNLIYMGTLGKAAGVGGAFIAAHASVIELLIQCARPYIYTTASPPALSHALQTSLDIIGSDEGRQRRAHLRTLAQLLRDELKLARWQLNDVDGAIQPIIIGSNEAALHASAQLKQQGLWVTAIRPPTVAPGSARLRVTLSAAHEQTDVIRLARALNDLERAAA